MTKKSTEKAHPFLTLPKMTSTALKGKQSVRTSFKLSDGCIQAINIIATQLGIKHRSLFNYLVEDTEALEALAHEIEKKDPHPNKGIQKSFIVSRESLRIIDEMSAELNVSRDTLIELSVRRLLPIIEKEMESHDRRKELLALVQNHYKDSKDVLNQIKKSVGEEDPIYKIYRDAVRVCRQVKTQINDIVLKGNVIEGFDPKTLKS
jgi:hypothetical protein